jgi:hypothetical protein
MAVGFRELLEGLKYDDQRGWQDDGNINLDQNYCRLVVDKEIWLAWWT